MANIFGLALEGWVAAVDAVAPSLGVSAEGIQAFDDAAGVVTDEVNGASNEEIVTDIILAVVVTYSVPADLIAAAGAGVLYSIVGDEGILAATAVVNEALATTMPGAFSLSAGDAVVGTASKFLGNLVVSAGAIPTFSQFLSAATELLSSPSSVSVSGQTNQTNVSGEIAAVISDGGNITVGANALPTIFNSGSVVTTGSYALQDTASTPAMVTNSGVLEGQNGVIVYGAGSLITNLGSIVGTNGDGIVGGEATTLFNFGTISGGIYGADLGGGSSITNGSTTDTTASISGGALAILMGAGANSVANFGKISGVIEMNGAGQTTVTNGSAGDPAASMSGGIYSVNATTVSNFGLIAGPLALTGGSSVTNGGATDLTASINGQVSFSSNAPGTVANFGAMVGGVTISGTGSVTNGSTGDTKASITAASGWGVNSYTGTVTNYGTVSGAGGVTITSGTVTNAGTIVGGAEGGISMAGGTIVNTGTIKNSAGGSGVAIYASSVIRLDEAAGSVMTGSISGSIGTIVNDSTIDISGGYPGLDVTTDIDPTSTGVFQLTNNGLLEIAAALGTNVKIQFLQNAGVVPSNGLIIDNAGQWGTNVGSASYKGPLLEGFTTGDAIDLKGIPYTATLSYSPASGDLQVSGGGKVATLQFQNSSLGAGGFHIAGDGYGNALITHS